jgi:hypothetical protein
MDEEGYISIPASIETVMEDDFEGCERLARRTFEALSHLIAVDRFKDCHLLCRVEIPASLVPIGPHGIFEYVSVKEVLFAANSKKYLDSTNSHHLNILVFLHLSKLSLQMHSLNASEKRTSTDEGIIICSK